MFKLLKLSANMPTFHTIIFNDGLNIILGKQNNKEKRKNTTNGIGKSLIIKLVDFCLGSNARKEWSQVLKDWIFDLNIQIENKEYCISRSINKQNKISINNHEFNVTKFREYFTTKLKLDDDIAFRGIISRFLRNGKSAYDNYFDSARKTKEFDSLKVISYLLGLEYKLVIDKKDLKKQLDTLKKFKGDDYIKNVKGLDKTYIQRELNNINYEIELLTQSLENCNIAENYAEMQIEANKISSKLDDLHNELFLVEENIKNIKNSLDKKIFIKLEDVKKIYDELGIFWNEKMIKSLQEIENFQCELLAKRQEQLYKDLLRENEKLAEIKVCINKNQSLLNNQLQFLTAHHAIDKYNNLVRKIDLLNQRKKELTELSNTAKDIENKIHEVKIKMEESNIKAVNYLQSINSKCSILDREFKILANQFYEEKQSSLSIENNSGENQIRFNIKAHITSDGSDGVREIIVFCFDWILLKNKITKQGFIYHDSLLIANVENRQREILFNLAENMCNQNNMQYIININEDQIENFSKETINLINEKIICTLSDDSVQSKLLGIEVDL